jgi:hypothetical protein
MTDATTRADGVTMSARSTATLVRPYEVADVLAQLMRDAVEVSLASGAGLLLARKDGDMELLSASSHRAIELGIYQVQSAYDYLTHLAEQRGLGLTEAALGVIAEAQLVTPTPLHEDGAH